MKEAVNWKLATPHISTPKPNSFQWLTKPISSSLEPKYGRVNTTPNVIGESREAGVYTKVGR